MTSTATGTAGIGVPYWNTAGRGPGHIEIEHLAVSLGGERPGVPFLLSDGQRVGLTEEELAAVKKAMPRLAELQALVLELRHAALRLAPQFAKSRAEMQRRAMTLRAKDRAGLDRR